MEIFESKWVNYHYIKYGVNSLWLGGLHMFFPFIIFITLTFRNFISFNLNFRLYNVPYYHMRRPPSLSELTHFFILEASISYFFIQFSFIFMIIFIDNIINKKYCEELSKISTDSKIWYDFIYFFIVMLWYKFIIIFKIQKIVLISWFFINQVF